MCPSAFSKIGISKSFEGNFEQTDDIIISISPAEEELTDYLQNYMAGYLQLS